MTRPKSRATAARVLVIVAEPVTTDGPGPAPDYVSHVGGQFDDAGYTPGRGQFGFVHHTLPD